MKKIILTLAALILFSMINVYAADEQDSVDYPRLFLKANEAYVGSDFKTSVVCYEKIISSGIINGEMFYNLGNSYLKTGEVGRAILNYRKAELLMPRDEDLQANLGYAYELTRDNIECKELVSFIENFCFWYSKLNVYELSYLFLAVNFLFWLLLAVRCFYRNEVLKIVFYITVFLMLVIGPSSGFKIYNHYFVKKGVVTHKEILVRSGRTINGTVLFKLHEGAEFVWLQENEGWVKISLCDGKKGWVQKKVVDCIIL